MQSKSVTKRLKVQRDKDNYALHLEVHPNLIDILLLKRIKRWNKKTTLEEVEKVWSIWHRASVKDMCLFQIKSKINRKPNAKV